jgi:zinc/manganese transport system substrate-binding protein
MKRFIIVCITLIVLIGLPANSEAVMRVITTTQDLAAIAKEVGGEHVDVESLTPGTRDPHFAVAKPSMIRKVYKADLLLLIGADMEIGWLPPLLQSARNSRVQPGKLGYLELSNSVSLLDIPSGPVNRAMGDVHAKGNPHYWLDPRNGSLIAQAITERLKKLAPNHAEYFQTRLNSFTQKLDRKISEWQAALKPLENKPVIVYHKSFVYLENAFGFKIIGEVEPLPGIAPGASHLSQLVARIKAEKVELLIIEPYYEKRSSKYLNEQTGIKIAVLPQSVGSLAGIDSYFDLFDGIIAALKKAGVI